MQPLGSIYQPFLRPSNFWPALTNWGEKTGVDNFQDMSDKLRTLTQYYQQMMLSTVANQIRESYGGLGTIPELRVTTPLRQELHGPFTSAYPGESFISMVYTYRYIYNELFGSNKSKPSC